MGLPAVGAELRKRTAEIPTIGSPSSAPPWLKAQSEASLRASLKALGLTTDGDKNALVQRLYEAIKPRKPVSDERVAEILTISGVGMPKQTKRQRELHQELNELRKELVDSSAADWHPPVGERRAKQAAQSAIEASTAEERLPSDIDMSESEPDDSDGGDVSSLGSDADTDSEPAQCATCKKGIFEENNILCDQCDKCYHIDCLPTAGGFRANAKSASSVQEAQWSCMACQSA
jgi:hypothetical protein